MGSSFASDYGTSGEALVKTMWLVVVASSVDGEVVSSVAGD